MLLKSKKKYTITIYNSLSDISHFLDLVQNMRNSNKFVLENVIGYYQIYLRENLLKPTNYDSEKLNVKQLNWNLCWISQVKCRIGMLKELIDCRAEKSSIPGYEYAEITSFINAICTDTCFSVSLFFHIFKLIKPIMFELINEMNK